jgi:hypothetical protein
MKKRPSPKQLDLFADVPARAALNASRINLTLQEKYDLALKKVQRFTKGAALPGLSPGARAGDQHETQRPGGTHLLHESVGICEAARRSGSREALEALSDVPHAAPDYTAAGESADARQ